MAIRVYGQWGGMGDVLTGVITSFIAQGLGLLGAAELGVCVHSKAANIAAQQGEWVC